MKKIIVVALLLIVSVVSFSQQTKPSPVLTKQDYLEKSKKQKTAAWILLVGGAACTITGIAIETDWNNPSFSHAATGVVVGGIGVLSMLGSIPEFITSGKNKRRAMSIAFKNETVPQIQNGSFINHPIPSLTVKIIL